MKEKLGIVIFLLTIGALVGGGFASAHAEDDAAQIIGTKKCKMCHKSTKSGNQWGVWEASVHAKAYETLASEESKAIAAEKGLGDPQQETECLRCHTTSGFLGADVTATEKYDITAGVGCESCHGAGSMYKKKSIMKDREAAVANGLVLADEKQCLKCHNEESPTYKEFVFEERWAEIAHPVPEAADAE